MAAPTESPHRGLSAEHCSQVIRELQTILGSAAFRGSKRSQEFLSYVVNNGLADRQDLLKERSIGVALFGRPASYETGEDAIVRRAATEVRQRLRKYRDEASVPGPVDIDLPVGAYAPEFNFLPPESVRSRRPRNPLLRRPWLSLAAVVGLLAAIIAVQFRRAPSPLERYWMPLLRSPSPVRLVVPEHKSYVMAFEARGPAVAEPSLAAMIEKNVEPCYTVSPYMARAATLLSSYLASVGKASQMRMADSTTFIDLRSEPTIMLGAFNNEWTLRMTKELPFAFEGVVGKSWTIREHAAPWRTWTIPDKAVNPAPMERDYAVISRVVEKETGQPFIALGSLGRAGSEAAAECLTSAECMGTVARIAPRNWERKNVQIVITAKIVAGTPGAPEVLAVRVW